MKGHSPAKPASVIASPGSTRISAADMETAKEANEYHIENQRLKAKRDREMGKVAAMLGAAVMITDKTFPFLTMKDGHQARVSEWYPGLSIAVDKFYVWRKENEAEVAFKSDAFSKNGIRYGYLSPSMQLHDLADQLGLADKVTA